MVDSELKMAHPGKNAANSWRHNEYLS